MRIENGEECPETLGEYRDICASFGGEDCAAVEVLDAHIANSGRDDVVIKSDAEMRALLMPMLIQPRTAPR